MKKKTYSFELTLATMVGQTLFRVVVINDATLNREGLMTDGQRVQHQCLVHVWIALLVGPLAERVFCVSRYPISVNVPRMSMWWCLLLVIVVGASSMVLL